MANESKAFYVPGMSPYELASAVLKDAYGEEKLSIPIDPFRLMRKHGIIYQLMKFEDLEGIYLVPENEDDVAVVGINYKRKITRQRYTAAHELCHHIKDRKNEACPIGAKNEIEQFAEKFAAELLMPRHAFYAVAHKYMKNGMVSLDDALYISECFGVSFRACVLRLAYTFHILDGDYSELNKRISDYKPDKKKSQLGMDIDNIELLRQMIDSYEFYFQIKENCIWYRFKNDFIYNENRMEGLNLDEEEVAEIVTDLRMNHQESAYCKEEYEDIIQVVGHAELYDYILKTDEKLSIYKILDLNRKLFQFAPFPDEAGKTRTDNNLVLGTKFETVDWRDVATELIKLQEPVEELVEKVSEFSTSEYLLQCLKIHHRITQIHPFRDGNGRSSRALLNWMIRLKGLPPIYFKVKEKDSYYTALEQADKNMEYKELLRVTIRAIFYTIMNVK
jgi:Zn-dependent peptidase ImmA (M78 family)/fido (protein-threonine AMPylation protein)